MSCENCYSGPAARERARAEITKQAKQYVQRSKKGVVIYEDPIHGWQFIEESLAGGLAVRELIPYAGDLATG